jgi:molybdenum cofactor cytidylyltransferase
MPVTYAVIIAAGLSSRMKTLKPLLPLDGKPAIRYLADSFFSAGVKGIVIVTGFQAEQIRSVFRSYSRIIFGHNSHYASSDMFASAKIGFEHLPDDCERVLFTPADVALISVSILKKIMLEQADLLFPSYQYHRGHPVAFHAKLLPSILRYDGPMGLNGAFRSLSESPAYLGTEDPTVVMDMDTPEDYQKLVQYLKDH